MTTSKKEFNASLKKAKDWDGKSRVSNDTYRESWNRIFGGKTEKEEENNQERRTEAKGLQFVRQKIVTIRYMAGQVAKTRNIA